MVKYTCFRCGFTTFHAGHFKVHCERTNTCQPLLDDIPVDFDEFVKKSKGTTPFQCSCCAKFYKTAASLNHHARKCVANTAGTSNTVNNFDNSTNNIDNSTHNHIHNDNSTHNHIHNDNSTHIDNSTTNNITIQVLPFGKENVQDILEDKPFMIKCVRNAGSHGMLTLMKRIHFNNEHPENKNVNVKSLKRHQMEVMGDDERWHLVDDADALDNMMRRGKIMLFKVYDDELRENDDEDSCFNLLRHVFDMNNNKYYLVRRKIHNMAYAETRQL
jgi:hypothetical protein